MNDISMSISSITMHAVFTEANAAAVSYCYVLGVALHVMARVQLINKQNWPVTAERAHDLKKKQGRLAATLVGP